MNPVPIDPLATVPLGLAWNSVFYPTALMEIWSKLSHFKMALNMSNWSKVQKKIVTPPPPLKFKSKQPAYYCNGVLVWGGGFTKPTKQLFFWVAASHFFCLLYYVYFTSNLPYFLSFLFFSCNLNTGILTCHLCCMKCHFKM